MVCNPSYAHILQDEALLQVSSHTDSSVAHTSDPPTPSQTPPPGSTASETQGAPSQHAAGTYMTIAGHLGRLAVLVSCRTAEEFWPPTSAAQPCRARSVKPAHSLLLTSSMQEDTMIGDERPVVALISEGGLVQYGQVLPCDVYTHGLLLLVLQPRV